MSASCPWCNAPRDVGPAGPPGCPTCGAIYAKAEAIKAHGSAKSVAPAPAAPGAVAVPSVLDLELDLDTVPPADEWKLVEDADLEWKFCVAAIPLGSQDGMDADPLVLVQEFGWTLEAVAGRYFALGLLCLIALAAVYAWGVRSAAAERTLRAARPS